MLKLVSVAMLTGLCCGLTLTRDENTAVVTETEEGMALAQVKAAGAILRAEAFPLTEATGLDPSVSFRFAYEIGSAAIMSQSSDGVTLTCVAGPCFTSVTAADGLTKIAEKRTIDHNDQNGQISWTTVELTTNGNNRRGYIHVRPYKPLTPGRWTVQTTANSATQREDSAANQDLTAVWDATDSVGAANYRVVVQSPCDTKTTKTTCETDAGAAVILPLSGDQARADCIWNGIACEVATIKVTGGTYAAASSAACTGGYAANAADGTYEPQAETVGTGTTASSANDRYPEVGTCTTLGDVNGDYTSKGMYNGKPQYSKDWSEPLEKGGCRIQWETGTSATLTARRGDEGWTLVCAGATRHTLTTGSKAKPLTTTTDTWALVTNFGAGTITVAEASSCASGYSGTPTSTAGCIKDSSSRRRRKHKNKKNVWRAPANDATPCTWWTWWNCKAM